MMRTLRSVSWRTAGLLFVCGAAWSLAFAPVHWAWLQLPGLALAWWLARAAAVHGVPIGQDTPPVEMPAARWRHALMAGWWYGFGMFTIGVCWLFISLHHFGGVPAPIAVGAVVALAAYMALFPAFAFALSACFDRQPGVLQAVAFASTWTLGEWGRAWLFTGFPWLATGEAWVDTPLGGFYPVVGSFGVAWLVALMSVALALGYFPSRSEKGVDRQGSRLPAILAPAVLVAVVAGIGAVLKPLDWGAAAVAQVRVHLVQPNVSQTIKFDPDHITRNFMDTIMLGRVAGESSAPGDWLMFPETALPVLWQEAPAVWRNAFAGMAWEYQTPVVMGAALQDGADIYTNSVIALMPDQPDAPEQPSLRYDKRHLVPFGEFIPPGFRWFVDLMDMPLGDFTRGQGPAQTFELGPLRLLPNVCYEDVFGHELAALVRGASAQPHVLFNVSNLAWFGGSWALDQHAQMSRARAAELRKPMIRSTNTGVSGIIDAQGQWVLRLPDNERTSASGVVQGFAGLTPYARWGLLMPVGLAIGGLLLAWGFSVLCTSGRFARVSLRDVQ